MTKIVGQGVRATQRTLTERLTELEKGFAQVLFKINQRFSGLDAGLLEANEAIEALVELASSNEEVQRIITRNRIARARAQAAKEKESLEEGVKEGFLTVSEKVGERTLLVGRYSDKDGKVEEPGRVQLAMPAVAEPFRGKLLGQAAGASLDLPTGGKFELLEAYEVDDVKYREVMLAKQKAAQEAATQAAKAQGDADEAKDAQPEPAQDSEEQ